MTLFSVVPEAESASVTDFVLGLQDSTGPGTGNTARLTIQQIINLFGTFPPSFADITVTGTSATSVTSQGGSVWGANDFKKLSILPNGSGDSQCLNINRVTSAVTDTYVSGLSWTLTDTAQSASPRFGYSVGINSNAGADPGEVWGSLFGFHTNAPNTSGHTHVAAYSQMVRDSVPSGHVGTNIEAHVFETHSLTGLPSSQDGIMRTIELDMFCAGADDLAGGVGREIATVVVGKGQVSDTAPTISSVMGVYGSSGYQTTIGKVWHTEGFINISDSVLSSRGSTLNGGANAIWLGTNHPIALDTSAATKIVSDGTTVAVTGTILAESGIINAQGSGTSGSFDGQIKVTGGGSSAGQGVLQHTAAQHNLLGYDASVQFRGGLTPGSVEYWQAQGGQSGVGGALYATNGTQSGNVDGTLVAQNAGGLWFGNGAGLAFQILDPGAPASNNLIIKAGTASTDPVLTSTSNTAIDAASGNKVFFSINGIIVGAAGNTKSAASSVNFPILYGSDSGGVGIQSTNVAGSGAVNLNMQAQSTGNVVLLNASGNFAVFTLSDANTADDSFVFRDASTTSPLKIQGSGGATVAVGGGTIATNATKGFFMVPNCAGAPTGTPASTSGGTCLVFDTTDLKLYAYVGGAWKASAAFT